MTSIFISHSSNDQDVADRAEQALKDAGYTVVAMRQWRSRSNWRTEMEKAAEETDHTLALWSSSYFKSDECKREMAAALERTKKEGRKVFVPARINDDPIPSIYVGEVYEDLRGLLSGPEIAACVRAAIKDEPGKPSARTVYLPPVPGAIFFGRDAYEADLDRVVLKSNRAAICSVQGLGGVGKTTLALHYAHLPAVAARFPIRWWVVAESVGQIHDGFARLARALRLADDNMADEKAAAMARDWLRAAPRDALILYDNAVDGALLAQWLPGENAALATTRIAGMAGLQEIPLESWADATSRDFLLERTGQTDAEAALALGQALGGLPLACEQAAAYCIEAALPLAEYQRRFDRNPARMMSKRANGSTEEQTVAKTFALAIERAAQDCAHAPALLSVMAELAAAPLPLAVFGHDAAPEGLREEDDLDDAVDALIRWALMWRVGVKDALQDVETPCLDAHRLVRLAAADDAPPQKLKLAVQALGGAFPGDETSNMASWPLCAALAPHVDSGWDIAMWEIAAAEGARRAQDRTATFFEYARADYRQAHIQFSAALANAVATHGADATETATQLSNLANVLRNLGGAENLTQARAALARALPIFEATHGPDHPEVATALSNLANVLYSLGGAENLTQARAALERALRIDEAAHGPDHPNVAATLSNLAEVLRNLGGAENLTQARAALERALRIDEAAHGPDHPSVAIRLSNLANVLHDLDGAENLTQARAALERALGIDEAAHGPDHPSIGIRLINLAHVLIAQGDIPAAIAAAERGHAIFKASLGPDHGHTQIAQRLLDGLR